MARRWRHRPAATCAAAGVFVALLLGTAAAPGRAQEAPGRGAGDPESRPLRYAPVRGAEDGGGGLGPWLRTLGALALVAVLVFAVRAALRRLHGAGRAHAAAGAMEVVAETPLEGRGRLTLVRLGRRLVLVGTGPTGMSPLAEVTDPAEVAELLEEASRGGGEVLKRPAGGNGATKA